VPKGIHRVKLDMEVGADRYNPENINKLSKVDTFTEALSAIKDLMIEIIGEDSEISGGDTVTQKSRKIGANQLRAELRSLIKGSEL
jgi:hypothetical protein